VDLVVDEQSVRYLYGNAATVMWSTDLAVKKMPDHTVKAFDGDLANLARMMPR
jgi:hypothetical protein